jgi:probable selenium-dependent hydroxylase accessory protein YqeC
LTPIKIINGLKDALNIHPKEIISLVGAGGKTTIMFALSHELATYEKVVITTTTTKIFTPSSSDTPYLLISHTPYLLISREKKEIFDFILKNGNKLRQLTLASEKLANSGKLKGITPELVSQLIKLDPTIYIIVEADGAACRPLKAPNPTFEPVIPQDTSLVIPVIGIDALGCELKEQYVFRSEIAAKLTGLSLGEAVSANTIVNLLLHPSGIIRGSPDQARIIPFINKIDLLADLSEARDLASKILEADHPRIDRVVLGQAQLKPPVAEVVFSK